MATDQTCLVAMSDFETSETSRDLTAPSVSRPVVLLMVIGALLVGFAVGDRLARQHDAVPKVVDTYCTPIADDGRISQTGLGRQVRVREDGSEFVVPVVERERDGVITYDGVCRTPVPAPSSIDVRNDPLFP